MAIYQLGDDVPQLDATAYVTESASVIGKVRLEAHASIWFGVTIRGDNELITVGAGTNVQENCVLHTDIGCPMVIGRNVTIGHQAMLHGCTVGDGTLIGIQAVVMNKAEIGKNCLVGAGALITEGKKFPDNAIILGRPAKIVRTLTPEEIDKLALVSKEYVARAQHCRTSLKRIDKA